MTERINGDESVHEVNASIPPQPSKENLCFPSWAHVRVSPQVNEIGKRGRSAGPMGGTIHRGKRGIHHFADRGFVDKNDDVRVKLGGGREFIGGNLPV